jgi:hypothetical protein
VQSRLRRSVVVLVATWAAAVLALGVLRPHPVSPLVSWSGDDVARVACWALLAAYAAWLTVLAVASSIVAAGHGGAAVRVIGAWAPPVVRHVLRAALAGTLAVAPTTVPPVTLHVGPDGRLSRGPVPASTRTTTTTTTTTTPSRPVPQPAIQRPRVEPARQPRHRVVAGDNLWTIARAELARLHGRVPDDRELAPYWLRVVAANRATLRSGDPSLIYPGEIVSLPNP